jgi:hypothetical protein
MQTRTVALFLIAFFISSSAAYQLLDFSLEYNGSCGLADDNGYYQCESKASSETLTTKITPGSLHVEVSHLLGLVSHYRAWGHSTSNQSTQEGNFTFGTHQNHEQHILNFQTINSGSGSTLSDGSYIASFSYTVTTSTVQFFFFFSLQFLSFVLFQLILFL